MRLSAKVFNHITKSGKLIGGNGCGTQNKFTPRASQNTNKKESIAELLSLGEFFGEKCQVLKFRQMYSWNINKGD
jgi:hypothetical protein